MTRLMGDAIHAQVPALAQVPGLQLVAGYDSGSIDIDWTPADWARFPGLPQVHIDQANNSTVNTKAHAIVFDIEPGAYQPGQAAALISQNTTPRPTVYCDRAQLAATVASALQAPNWRGDVWLAFPGWNGQTSTLPVLPSGASYVAVQDRFTSAYDLSTVLDPTWPLEADVVIPGVPGLWLSVQILSSADGSRQVAIGLGTDGALWQAVRANGVWAEPVPV